MTNRYAKRDRDINSIGRNALNRILEIVPGFIFWVVLTSPFWMSGKLVTLIGNMIIILSVYWLYRALFFQAGVLIGYFRYKKEIKINWLEKCLQLHQQKFQNETNLDFHESLPYHLIVFPIASANFKTISKSLEAIVSQNYPLKKIFVSLSFEQRFIDKDPENYELVRTKIFEKFKSLADRLMIFNHPKDIQSEAIGAAANRTWGTKTQFMSLNQGDLIYRNS
jgi:hypothetical protein